MQKQGLRTYYAIYWRKEPDSVGRHVEVMAHDGDDAIARLKSEFGEDIHVFVSNHEGAEKLRGAGATPQT
ncbi:hypothetical protein OU426_06900 [Frigidibacter sp. RF13]|uniref:hypothetical protein n=1 Tax=Frigidibacter sp. RF13 TaxID=2997340 RepID=UPI002271EF36|nr:hypothetical protein [Frigidibacter sp. RF13]MCY1126577.1 hypothetical protein [Frigidibacter sp. RF13]